MNMPRVRPVKISTKGLPWYRRIGRLAERRRWQLVLPYMIEVQGYGNVLIPDGFTFDGASIPRWAWWVPGMDPVGVLMIPAIVHDYAYTNHVLIVDGRSRLIKRKQADDLFLQVSRQVNGSMAVDWIAWAAVRIFGGAGWRYK